MASSYDLAGLNQTAGRIRVNILTMLNQAGSGHTGGSLSAVEIMTSLFFVKMRLDRSNLKWADRDRFVLSKGHAAPVYYATLRELNYLEQDKLCTLRSLGSSLQGHPDCEKTPGVEVSTGSLGQGLSMALGMALGLRLDGRPSRVYALLGDGEVQEGQIWEAAMAAAHYKADNLCAFIDNNHLQIDGRVEDIMNPEPLADKWRAFGWRVFEIDGHDFGQIIKALDQAEQVKGQPSMIIAQTVKGKGVSFFENKAQYHGVAPSDEELEKALKELGANT